MSPLPTLKSVLASLSVAARSRGLSDSAWARRAGLPKETLSRLRRRSDCDWSTLQRLAGAAGQRLQVAPDFPLTPDRLFPARLSRDVEERLYQLVRSGTLAPEAWRAAGPSFFMAGLAVLIAGSPGYDRQGLLRLAEQLHPGICELPVYNRWLQLTPLEPSRFFAQLEGGRDAA